MTLVRLAVSRIVAVGLLLATWTLVVPDGPSMAFAKNSMTIEPSREHYLKVREQLPARKPAKSLPVAQNIDKKKHSSMSKPAKALVININTATVSELMQLPGIGPSKAKRIVAYRKKKGKFRRTKDLRRVKGIGYRTWKRLQPMLTTTGETVIPK